MTLTHLAARKGADAALIDRLVKYLDSRSRISPTRATGRGRSIRLLIALDRPKELETELRSG